MSLHKNDYMFFQPSCFKYFALLVILILSGCEHIDYLSQAAWGQFNLIHKRQSINKIITNKKTPIKLKNQLLLAKKVLSFAERELDLPVGKTYGTYVDINRDYVVWNVITTPSLSLKPIQTCYFMVGCHNYRGYFNQADAIKKAQALKEQGHDVYVGGVRAYSTLGWFNDPLLSTFIFDTERQLVELIIHELVHKKRFIQNDTAFNESLATAVSYIGLSLWQSQPDPFIYINQDQQYFTRLLRQTALALDKLYKSDLNELQKRHQKESILSATYTHFIELTKKGLIGTQYDNYIKTLNNAKLSAVMDYHQFVPAFIKLKNDVDSWDAFYKAIDELAKLDINSRHASLEKIMQGEDRQ